MAAVAAVGVMLERLEALASGAAYKLRFEIMDLPDEQFDGVMQLLSDTQDLLDATGGG